MKTSYKDLLTIRNFCLLFSILVSLYISLLASVALDGILDNHIQDMSLLPGALLLDMIKSKSIRQLFFFIFLSCMVMVFYIFWGNNLSHKSKVVEILPGLTIPKGEGEGQYGQAWFTAEKDLGKIFGIVEIPREIYEPLLERKEALDTGTNTENRR